MTKSWVIFVVLAAVIYANDYICSHSISHTHSHSSMTLMTFWGAREHRWALWPPRWWTMRGTNPIRRTMHKGTTSAHYIPPVVSHWFNIEFLMLTCSTNHYFEQNTPKLYDFGVICPKSCNINMVLTFLGNNPISLQSSKPVTWE